MENLLTYFKGVGALHLRCPLCGTVLRLVLPDREGAPLQLEGLKCKHLTISADAIRTKVDMVDVLIYPYERG